MKLNKSQAVNGKINLTKEVLDSEKFNEILKSKGLKPENFQKWREKNPNVDLSIYTINE
jgi:hypothetical protein